MEIPQQGPPPGTMESFRRARRPPVSGATAGRCENGTALPLVPGHPPGAGRGIDDHGDHPRGVAIPGPRPGDTLVPGWIRTAPDVAWLGAVLLLMACRSPRASNGNDDRLETWTTERGLPDNGIERLHQSRDGWLWVGTRNGLARFDGVSFTRFDAADGSHPTGPCVDIAEDGQGALWIATRTGLYQRTPAGFKVYHAADGLGHDQIRSLAIAPDGTLWIGTGGGIAWSSHGTFENTPHRTVTYEANHREVIIHGIETVHVDSGGRVWAGSTEGLLEFDRARRQFRTAWQPEAPGDNADPRTVRVIQSARSPPHLWLGINTGLVDYDPVSGSSRHLRFPPQTGSARIRRITVDPDGTLSVVKGGRGFRGTRAGIEVDPASAAAGPLLATDMLRTSPTTAWLGTRHGGLIKIQSSALKAFTTGDGLDNNLVFAVAPAVDGGVWVGTAGGLQHFRDGRFTRFNATAASSNQPDLKQFELSSAACSFVFQSQPGELWIHSTTFGGDILFVAEPTPSGRTFSRIPTQPNPKAMLEDRQGRVWIGTQLGIACLLDQPISYVNSQPFEVGSPQVPVRIVRRRGERWYFHAHETILDCAVNQWKWQDNDWHHSSSEPDAVQGRPFSNSNSPLQRLPMAVNTPLAGADVRSVVEDSKGGLWFGTWGHGLFRWNGTNLHSFQAAEGFPDLRISRLLMDGAGSLWAATPSGLACLRPGTDPVPSHRPFPGRVVHGFQVSTLRPAHGLPRDSIVNLIEDHEGYLWLGTPSGLFRFAREELAAVADGRRHTADGLRIEEVRGWLANDVEGRTQSTACVTSDRFLWFATSQGLVRLNPDLVRPNDALPRPFIQTLSGIPVERSDLQPLAHPRLSGSVVAPSLPPGSGKAVEIQYTAFEFNAPSQIRFRYRLLGHDRQWIDAGNRRVARFNNLKPGSFQFVLQAANGDGRWNETDTILAFRIEPHFHETMAFRSAALASLGLLGFAASSLVARLRLRNVQARHVAALQESDLRRERALNQERQRISADLHDGLGADIDSLNSLAQLASLDAPPQLPLRPRLHQLLHAARELDRSLKAAVFSTQPDHRTCAEFVTHLRWQLHDRLDLAGIECDLVAPPASPRPIDPAVAHGVLMILREGLRNVLRHSGATRVTARIDVDHDGFSLRLSDNGCGFKADDPGPDGNGLRNMKARAAALHGTLAISSHPGRGTNLDLKVPLPNPGPPQEPR